MSNGPPFGPPNTYTVSSLAGSDSTASSAVLPVAPRHSRVKQGRCEGQTRGTLPFRLGLSLPSLEAGGQKGHQKQKEEER